MTDSQDSIDDLDSTVRSLARANPAMARALREREARCGRACVLGIEIVAGIVVADVVEHGVDLMPPGTAHVEVWCDDPVRIVDLVAAVVARMAPDGVRVTMVARRARAWHRLRGWWRVMVARLRGQHREDT